MQVQESQASMSLLKSQGSKTAAGLDAGDFQNAMEKVTGSAVNGGAGETAAHGVTSPGMSSEIVGHLVQATQGAAKSAYDGPLPQSVRNGLTDAFNNPDYAAKQAEGLATSRGFVWVKDLPGNDAPFSEWKAFLAETDRRRAYLDEISEERKALYDELKSSGMPPIEILSRILEFNSKLPDSYNHAMGQPLGFELTSTEFDAARHEFLEELLAKGSIAEGQHMGSAAPTLYEASSVADLPVDDATAKPTRSDAVQEFLDYMNKTPEERLFEKYLKELGLTKEQFEALPPEERMKVEAKIREKVERDVEMALATSAQTDNEEKTL